jgi:hypothetical protein
MASGRSHTCETVLLAPPTAEVDGEAGEGNVYGVGER